MERRITSIVAGAGFGKSTLLAYFAAQHGAAWYAVGPEDAALDVFYRGLLDAIRRRVPNLAKTLGAATYASSGPTLDDLERAQALAGLLAEGIEDAGPLPLVIDDLHELGVAGPSAVFVEALVRQAPPGFHLVISSRQELPFRLQRLKGSGAAFRLEASELAFTLEETRTFVASLWRQRASEPIPAADIDRVHELTQGWPAAVRLATEALRRSPPDQRSSVLAALDRPAGPLFAYLGEEVVSSEPPAVLRLLRIGTSLGPFSGELCEALGESDAAATLSGLASRGLFLATAADGSFRVHALVRAFVQDRFSMAPDELADVHKGAAEWYLSQGRVQDALRSLTVLADGPGIAGLLERRGHDLVAGGAPSLILEAIACVPEHLRTAALLEVAGEAHGLRGEWAEALECYGLAAPADADWPASLALRVGQIYVERGQLGAALDSYRRARLDGSQPADEARTLAEAARAEWHQGNVERASDGSRIALQRAIASGDDRAIATAHAAAWLVWRDDEDRADHHYREARRAGERAGDVPLMARIRTNRGTSLLGRGFHIEAIEELNAALRLTEIVGMPLHHAVTLDNRGRAHFQLGRLDDALVDLQGSRDILQEARSTRVCWPLANLGSVYLERGDVALARGTLREALRIALAARDMQAIVLAEAELARVVAGDDPAEAETLARHAVAIGQSTSRYELFALVSAGWVMHFLGREAEATQLAAEASAAGASSEDRRSRASAIALAGVCSADLNVRRGLLEEAAATYRELGARIEEAKVRLALCYVGEIGGPGVEEAEAALRALGVRGVDGVAGILSSLPQVQPASVAIKTLGGFRTVRTGKPVGNREWRSRRAQTLLKILAARRGRPVSREFLKETLWPEDPPEDLANRLSVALSTVRSLLDPAHAFVTEHFIAVEGTSLRLDLSHVALDVNRFLMDAAEGLRFVREGDHAAAAPCLHAAELAYAGDFLEEDEYEDWAVPTREEARAAYIAVARELALAADRHPDHEAATRYRLRILERDPYDEEAHLGLVAALSRSGRHGEARRAYGTYLQQMRELGVEASPFPGRRAQRTGAAAV